MSLSTLLQFCFAAIFFQNAVTQTMPSGEVLYFEEKRQGKGQLVILNVETGKKTTIPHSGSRPDHYPSWSQDGSKIAFESYRKGGWHIWVMDASGSNARRLSNLPNYNTSFYEFDPSFGPNNTIVFTQGEDLWTVTLQNAKPSRLTPRNNGIDETAAVFPRMGRKSLLWDIINRTQVIR